MNWLNIITENTLASMPIEITNRVWWWASLNFGTLNDASLYALALLPALVGLLVGTGFGMAIARIKTIPLPLNMQPQVLAVLCAVLLLPGIPFKAMLILLAAVLGLPLMLPLACAAFSHALAFYIAVYLTRDAAVLAYTLKFFGLLPA